jgi:serine/threonine protein phosphatase 1
VKFLSSLKSSFIFGDFFFVHAGIRPGIPLSQQRDEDLLWIREDFLLCEEDFGKIIVHGHTPVLEPEIRPNRINVDTGAYATGKLTCLILEQNAVFAL